jgi:hypothetical protein
MMNWIKYSLTVMVIFLSPTSLWILRIYVLKFLTPRKKNTCYSKKVEKRRKKSITNKYTKRKGFCSHLFTTKLRLVPQDGKSSAC